MTDGCCQYRANTFYLIKDIIACLIKNTLPSICQSTQNGFEKKAIPVKRGL